VGELLGFEFAARFENTLGATIISVYLFQILCNLLFLFFIYRWQNSWRSIPAEFFIVSMPFRSLPVAG